MNSDGENATAQGPSPSDDAPPIAEPFFDAPPSPSGETVAWRPGIVAFFGTIALLGGVVSLSWSGPKLGLRAPIFLFPYCFYLGLPLVVIAIFGFAWFLRRFDAVTDRIDKKEDPVRRNALLYGRFISLLGTGILLLSLVNAITLGGLIFNEVLVLPFSDLAATTKATAAWIAASGNILFISMLMAILGSLFFTANTLIAARNDGKTDFSRARFWSGLWFRMGESVLFVLVFFVLICSKEEYYDDFIGWMPALSLFVGMFVKSGERVVFGIAERLFEMARGLLPASTATTESLPPGPARNLSATLQNHGTVRMDWDEPVIGGPVTSYRIYRMKPGKSPSHVGETPPGTRVFTQALEPGERAHFHVTALNNDVEGKASNRVEAFMPEKK